MSTTMAKTQTLIYRRTTLLEKLGISKQRCATEC